MGILPLKMAHTLPTKKNILKKKKKCFFFFFFVGKSYFIEENRTVVFASKNRTKYD